jgi:hypothetical protein
MKGYDNAEIDISDEANEGLVNYEYDTLFPIFFCSAGKYCGHECQYYSRLIY